MIMYSGYKISQTLYEGRNSLVYRGQRETDGQAIVLKVLREDYPSPERIAWFKREYEVTYSLNPASLSSSAGSGQAPSSGSGQALLGVAAVYGLESDHHRWLMVLEDFGGESLQRLKIAGKLALPDFLKLALAVTDILGQIHQRHIIHKDINPSNIVLNPATGQVKIIDFGISTVLSRENPTFRNPNVLEGTLAYLSPEQTGRMNRVVDYRTDFYALGVTFYELLTGQLPFPSHDTLALVHSHIAQQPTPPHDLKPDLPEMLSKIVLKLMAKNAEERYQSALGLKADLNQCLEQWQVNGGLEIFPLGQHDSSDRFQIPQKLYGRDREIEMLLTAFERVVGTNGSREQNSESVTHKAELMLVSGYAGIGKSALVQEVYKPITRQQGYFIAGKFDQLQRDIPYASLVQAFRALIRQLLTESEGQIATWRQKLLAALGSNGRVIIEVIPEVEMIVGPQPEVLDLPPTEAQNRFNLVFQNFIRVFTQPEHPLVLFLDDLQWADIASLQLLKLLLTAPDSHYLFIIGAYRDNEVGAVHPLRLTLNEIQTAGGIVNQTTLGSLPLSHVNQFIADALHDAPETVRPLAELVLGKTNGNPFFMIEFLKSLYSEELLWFDFQRGGWRWDLAHIKAQDMTDNVIELMAGRVRKLGEKTQQVLKLAACIGNPFNLQTLATVYETSPRETAIDLWEALVEGLILPLSDTYKLMDLEVQGLTEEVTAEYKFAHDRIQQAVYSLIPDSAKQAVHRRVGQLLLHNTAVEEREQQIFDIVNQLNWSQALIESQAERDELAQLNLMAGQKAKASAAYQSAFNYLQVGVEQLTPVSGSAGENSWQRQYDLNLKVYEEAAETAYLSGKFEQMLALTETILQQARVLPDKIKTYEVIIQAYTGQNRLLEAIEIILQVLESLGMSFPEQPGPTDIMTALQETNMALANREPESLIDLPLMTDPDKLAAMRLLDSIFVPTFVASPTLTPLIVCKQVNLSVEFGNTAESSSAYVNYGAILCSAVEDYDTGYHFGQLALRLANRLNAEKFKPKIYLMRGGYVNPWKEHVPAILPSFLEGYEAGLETGDFGFGCNCLVGHSVVSYLIGKELVETEREMANRVQVLTQLGQATYNYWHRIYWQAVLNWLGQTEFPCRLSGEAYDEEQMMPVHLEANDQTSIFNVYFNKMILCYRFQEFHQAVDYSVKAAEGNQAGSVFAPIFNLYQSLAHLAILPELTEAEQPDILQKVAANQEKMKLWAEHAPMNYLHKYYLVEAERARVTGDDAQARDYYDQAISLAHDNEYLNEEALAYELAARFYLDKGEFRLARYYMRDAHYAYQHWGAAAKVKDLEEQYPDLLMQMKTSIRRTGTTTSTTDQRPSTTLDIASVLKASQTISGQIVLDTLLTNLMTIVIENAGAERGYLILPETDQHPGEADRWVIVAEGVIDQTEGTARPNIPLEEGNLSPAIVNYVARTQETVVLDDALHEGTFTQDTYIIDRQPKSVLCLPLLNQGQLIGLLYLENNLTTGAFTADRVELLNVLSSQAAISLENARLYDNLTTSEQRFRTLFENAPLGVFEVDLSQDRPFILAANRQAELLYGWSAEEFSTMPVEQLVPDDTVPDMRRLTARVRAGETATLESINQRRDGTTFPVRLSATPETGPGLARMIVTVEDITIEKQRQAETEAIEAERRRIAHEIHDGLAQDLAALRFKTTLWHDMVDSNPSQMHGELDLLQDTLNGSIREVRRSIFALRPIALEELGFFPALRQYTRNFAEQYDLQITLDVSGSEDRLPPDVELPLFRIVQESLNNVRKYAQAQHVEMSLDLAQAQGIILNIQDDGNGFEVKDLAEKFREGHFGLRQMRERIEAIKGTLNISSQIGQGTTITVVLPLE